MIIRLSNQLDDLDQQIAASASGALSKNDQVCLTLHIAGMRAILESARSAEVSQFHAAKAHPTTLGEVESLPTTTTPRRGWAQSLVQVVATAFFAVAVGIATAGAIDTFQHQSTAYAATLISSR